MLIKSPWETGTLIIDGQEVTFRNYTTEVPEYIGKKILLIGLYTINLTNQKELKDAKKILVVRESGLGDVLLATAIVRYIKTELCPEAEIDWLVSDEFVGLLEGNPYITNICSPVTVRDDASDYYEFVVKLNDCEFDHDSHYKHRTDIFASRVRGLGEIPDRKIDFFLTEEEKNNSLPAENYIVMVVSANCQNRVLPLDRLKEIAGEFVKRGLNVALLDKALSNGWEGEGIYNLCGKVSLRIAAQWIYKSLGILTPDTGMMHLASALNKRVVAYFGAIDWKLRKTHDFLLPLVKDIYCYPCNEYNCKEPKCISELTNIEIVENMMGYIGR